MASTLSPMRSKFSADRWPDDDPPPDSLFHPTDLDLKPARPLGKRALRGLVIFCLGVTATLAWQSHGDTAREMIANSAPQLGWVAPQATAVAQAAPNSVAPTGPAARSSDVQRLSLDLAAVRQSLDQITASQQQMADGIAKLQGAAARKPAPVAPLTSSQAPPVR